jgi:putative ABC transport system permease protein
METLGQDIRYGFRMLARNRATSAVVVLTMALGIGTTTGVFSVVNAVLLRPLHLPDVDRLVMLWETNAQTRQNLGTVSPANYLDWRNQNTAFAQMAIMQGWDYTLTHAAQTTRLRGTKVSPEFFSALGMNPLLGRAFAAQETAPVVILGHGIWQRLYGGDPGVIGSTVALTGGFGDAVPHTIIGVMPAGFSFPGTSELWLPYPTDTIKLTERGGWSANVVARLRPGVTRAKAQAEMNVIATRLTQAYPESNRDSGVRVTSLHEHLVQHVRLLLYLFQGAVLLILLVAVVNVANLLLERSMFRDKEMALRAALGASRGRIIRQLLSESLLLACAGGLSGLFIAYWGVVGFGRLASAFVPRAEESNLDGRVLGFALLVSLASGLVFGLAPALTAARLDPNECLKGRPGARRSAVHGPGRMQHALVIAEIALSLVLLTGAGLLLKSSVLLGRVPLGFRPQNVLTLELADSLEPLHPELTERLLSLPGVQAVGAVRDLPLGNPSYIDEASVEGELPKAAGELRLLYYNSVTPDYFRSMGIPMVKGRGITEQDTEGAPPAVVVNEAFVKRLLGGADPIGRRLRKGVRQTIVGVVGDVKYEGLEKEVQPHAYCSSLQARTLPVRYLVLRTASAPMQLAAAVREIVQSVEKNRPILSLRTMEQRIDSSTLPQRFRTTLITLFSVIGLILAAVGVYGVVSYSVAQRLREFGIRMALGARHANILQLVLRQALWLLTVGLALGLLGAAAATRVLKTFLFAVEPVDLMTFVSVAVVLAGAVLLASYLPARRAARIDPMVALRYE